MLLVVEMDERWLALLLFPELFVIAVAEPLGFDEPEFALLLLLFAGFDVWLTLLDEVRCPCALTGAMNSTKVAIASAIVITVLLIVVNF